MPLISREPHPSIPTIWIETYPFGVRWRSAITGKFIKMLVKVVCQARMDYDKPGKQLYIRGHLSETVREPEAPETEERLKRKLENWVKNTFGEYVYNLTDIDCWWETGREEGEKEESLEWHH